MKTKSLFVAGLAAMALLSCSKENPADNSTESASLALNVSTKTIFKGMEPEADISNINIQTMIIELYDVNKKLTTTKSLSVAEIAGAMNPNPALGDVSRIVIEGVSKEAVYAKIYAYQAASQTAADLGKSVNNFQNGFEAVPFYTYEGTMASPFDPATGLITINKSNDPAPGPGQGGHATHKIWTVEAKMAAYLARYEVKGAVKVAEVKPIAGGSPIAWAQIDVTGIYINNIKNEVGSTSPTLIKGNNQNFGQGDWAAGHPFHTGGDWSKMFDVSGDAHTTIAPLFTDNKVAAYQVFPQGVDNNAAYATDAAPHVIVRLYITPDKNVIDSEPYYAFVTLKKFQILDGKGGNDVNMYLNKVIAGEVYRIDLSTLAALTPGDVDPDPESAAADLYVKVTIDPWTELFLRPEL